MIMKKYILVLMLSSFFAQAFAERVDMRLAGADNSGKVSNSEIIKSVIDKLASKGGGTLFFPAGIYLTGPIEMKSNITIDTEAGAVLKFSDNFDEYLPFTEVRHEGVMMKSFRPLIYAYDSENITIKGEGTLDGSGKLWWSEFFKVLTDLQKNGKREVNRYQKMFENSNDMKSLYDNTNSDWHSTLERRFFRPPFIHPIRCKRIKIEGVKIINSPFWTVNPEFCDNVTITGITIDNPPSPNTDGINPESCKNVHISDCHISVGDDCVTIKSGRDLQGRTIGVPCENITITNCTMLSGHGGVVIGSEMSGGVRKVTISNCVFDGTDRGIRIKSTRGRGGYVEDVRVSNIVMSNIKEAFVFNLKYSDMPQEPKSERTPEYRNISVSDVIVRNVQTPLNIVGLEEAPITGIVLKNIQMEGAKGKSIIKDCKDIVLDNVVVNGEKFQISATDKAMSFQSSKSLGTVLDDISKRFGVRLKYDVDTTGLVLPYADFRIRPYSLEESLTNVLAPFDFKFVKQNDKLYKIKAYEYARRTTADGEKLLGYLSSLYNDDKTFEKRAAVLRKEVREKLGIDNILSECVPNPTIKLSKERKYNGYKVQNFALETLKGKYVCGSIYSPLKGGKHPLIICPNGHFNKGRYREDQQQRMGTLARMGAICVDYDLVGWGESTDKHATPMSHVMQAVNGVNILDYMLSSRKDIDVKRIGVNGGSGGGTQSVLLTTIDNRYAASAPVVSLSSYFDGGCPCESGMPIQQAGGGTCNAELAATFAPRPMLIVSDGGDWTKDVPGLEYPYLQNVYGFYNQRSRVENVHLPKEGHDFGINKRNAVYDFFSRVFNLDIKMVNEKLVTIESEELLKRR